VALGTNSTFGYALATIAGQGAAILSFFLLSEHIGHTSAVGLSELLGSVAYFAVITHTIFFYERTRALVPRPSWSDLWSSQVGDPCTTIYFMHCEISTN
jgi:hypothetical protein